MKKIILLIVLLFWPVSLQAQGDVVFLPIIFKGSDMAIDPQLIITDGTIEINLLQSGWKLADPYWNPQIAAYKGAGTFVNAQLAEGQRLVHSEYDNVVETIPLSLTGVNQAQAMKSANEALALLRQAGDYWTKPYEYNPVWIEVKYPCNACLKGYSQIIKGDIPELTNPFGQPSFSGFGSSVMEDITLVFTREPFWKLTKPGEVIGPLYNLIDNPDFELWNFGATDSEPDSWTNIETTHIAGENSQETNLPKFGQAALKIRVSGSTLAGASKGITQVINDTKDLTKYTVVAWVRSEGVSNGVGRILITYADQLELYRDSVSHGWTLYTGTITTGANDVVGISLEILTTAANTDGTIYIDGLMFLEGDWEQEAIDNVLPYMSGSHIVNQYNAPGLVTEAGNLNFVDAWNVPGSVDAKITTTFINNQEPADWDNYVEKYAVIRIGLRRANNVFNFRHTYDPPGVLDTTASEDDRLNSPSLGGDWARLFINTISGSTDTRDNLGRFRLIARVYDPNSPVTLKSRALYFIGDSLRNEKALDSVNAPISENWTIVDLTTNKSMNWQRKFSETGVSQLGYAFEMARNNNDSGVGRLDYVMTLPTDGGYYEAEISPGLQYKSQLFAGAIPEIGTSPSEKWRADYIDSTPYSFPLVFALKSFKGSLYAAILTGTAPLTLKSKILRKKEGVWTSLWESGVDIVEAFEVYNDKLYGGVKLPGGAGSYLLESSDGETFSNVQTMNSIIEITGMKSFGGYLYVGGSLQTLERYDGSSAVVINNAINGNFFRFKSYAGELYMLLDTAELTSYNQDTGVFTVRATPSGVSWKDIEVFNDFIFIGCRDANKETLVQIYGGSSTVTDIDISTELTDLITGSVLENVGLIKYNNKLFALTYQGPTFESEDGINWVLSDAGYPPGVDNAPTNVWSKDVYNGSLYAGSFDYSLSEGYIDSYTDLTAGEGAIGFKGTQFFGPSRTKYDDKRHRFIFSYDRINYINDKDDKAIIGLSFTPRYLEPPMKEN